MSEQYEVLAVVDQNLGDGLGWHLHPEVRDAVGFWPDGRPAVAPDPDWGEDGRRHVYAVIPKRQPEEPDSDFLEDHPAVREVISIACALNDVLRPRRGTPLGDVTIAGTPHQQAAAMTAHIRMKVGPDLVGPVLDLAQRIVAQRAAESGGDRS